MLLRSFHLQLFDRRMEQPSRLSAGPHRADPSFEVFLRYENPQSER